MADKFFLNSSDLLETRYSGVFGVADYEFEVSSKKFKMADLIWQTIFFLIHRIHLKHVTRGFLGSPL